MYIKIIINIYILVKRSLTLSISLYGWMDGFKMDSKGLTIKDVTRGTPVHLQYIFMRELTESEAKTLFEKLSK